MAPEQENPDMDPIPGAPSDNTTAVAELEELRQQGYGGDFRVVEGGAVRCRQCEHTEQAEELDIDVFRRLEGASEPDEMSAVLAITCPACGSKGTALVAYGPHASEDEADFLRRVDTPQEPGTAGAV
ncbi:MAG TPA: hypothetical protein VFU14_17235 [Acidimicrobiales bacterium]|nr:hypothetical protein [Acidimicrobiales bacterium]